MMSSRVLRLYNTFTRSVNDVRIGAELVGPRLDRTPVNGSFYICGPTVYSDSHLGHAITYTRADLFRRFMKTIFSVNLTTVMNITDIDDKILSCVGQESQNETENKYSSDPTKHPYNQLSDKYYQSFVEDMNRIRVQSPDLTIKVSKHMNPIKSYISRLEEKGHAYVTPIGDVYFDTSSVKNYVGRTRDDAGLRTNPDQFKRNPRDFVLWKAAKVGEPIWMYRSPISDRELPGRPGWHVQCSAIASSVFGDNLDFHFGGKDLIFPHHYNEEACCCAYHGLDTSNGLHIWSKHWLHSGHLVLKDYKMSKSVGNVITIGSFIEQSSVNALRLLCITNHYRSNIEFNSSMMENLKSLDHRLGAFVSYMNDALRQIRIEGLTVDAQVEMCTDIQARLMKTREDILEGVCDEFDIDAGLQSLLELAKVVYNTGWDKIRPNDLVMIWQLLIDWCSTCGIEYGPTKSTGDETMIEAFRDFRQRVRTIALSELKTKTNLSPETKSSGKSIPEQLLMECDRVRSRLNKLGFVSRDNKSSHKDFR